MAIIAIPHHEMLSFASVPAISVATTVVVADSLGWSLILLVTVFMTRRLRNDGLGGLCNLDR